MTDPNAIRLTLLILGIAVLAAAVVLTVTGNDAAVAWAGFTAIVGALIGQQLPVPTKKAT